MTSRDDQIAALLASSPPRSVPADLLRAAQAQAAPFFLAFFGMAFGGIGLIVGLALFPWNFHREWRLRAADTAEAPGKILTAEETNSSVNNTRVVRYWFEYQSSGGAGMQGECFTTGSRWPEGADVTVRYRRESPEIACPVGGRLNRFGFAPAFVLLFPFIGGGLVYWVVTARRRARNLLERGHVSEALVTAVEATNTQVNKQTVYRITLQRIDQPGDRPMVIKRYQPPVLEFARQRLANKQPVFVLFDPARPQRALLPETL